MTKLTTLQEENNQLKKKLEVAQKWMKKEIAEDLKKIGKAKINNTTLKEKTCFLNDNIEDIITDKIQDFFGELMLVNIPSTIIRNIISAEINYYNFRNNPSFDGFSVISSYHKALDIIIEEYITSDFRKFIDKSKLPKYIENNSLEKSLKSVILNNYSLSAGRLYHLLQIINDKEKLNHYTFLFSKFIKKHSYLEEILLEDKEFFEVYEKIINTEVLGSKRHSGRIDFVETREARRLLIGDFKDKNCLIYKLMMIGEV
ncbi:MAG: hypothetical protein Q9M94_03250 [Candidatus Gracilibacteria bacterium]|nr:hypothetical protein [Candidatus Gracilibacteria bacterium]